MRSPAVPIVLLVVAALIAPAAGVEAQVPPTPIVSSSYELGPRDAIRLEVAGDSTLTGEYRLTDGGTITLPLVGEVLASGRTAGELARHLEELLEKDFLADAQVRVQVTDVRSQTISVLGAVARPGTLGYPGDWTLLEALTAAGGMSTERGDSIHILRRADNGLSDQVAVPVEGLLLRGEPKYNLPVFAGDLINVERTRKITIYLLGEAAGTGAQEFDSTDRVTLLTLIARVGGLTDRASSRLRIKRRGSDDRMEEIRASYKRILAGDEPDVELHDGDIVVVDESFF